MEGAIDGKRRRQTFAAGASDGANTSEDGLTLDWTRHAKERLRERDLLMGDALHVLRHGFVQPDPEESTAAGLFKYRMDATTPNSNGREVRLVVIPSTACRINIVTVMWKDGT